MKKEIEHFKKSEKKTTITEMKNILQEININQMKQKTELMIFKTKVAEHKLRREKRKKIK